MLDGRPVAVKVTDHPDADSNGLFYLHTDHLGSVTAMTDESGNLVDGSVARHTPFGAYREQPATNPDVTDRGYTGHRMNNTGANGLGLIYMNARFYAPELRRFISADTIVPQPGNPQAFNRYAYVYNDTINLIDPSGYFTEDAIKSYLREEHGEFWLHYWNLWQTNNEFWTMLLNSEAGDMLLVGLGEDGGAFYAFTGEGDYKLTGIKYSKDPYGNELVGNTNPHYPGWRFDVKLANIESGISPQHRRPGTKSVIDTTNIQWSATIRWLSNTEFVFRGARRPYYHLGSNDNKTFATRAGIAGLEAAIPMNLLAGMITGGIMEGAAINDRLFYDKLGAQFGDEFWMINEFTLVPEFSKTEG